ncbi:pyrroline-5-carboxylate reductase [Chloroflexota bacterium]
MKIAFIGGGNMGEAILAAVLEKGLSTPEAVGVGEVSEERRRYLKDKYGVVAAPGNREVIADADIIVLAVKPQNLPDVMAELKGCLEPNQLVISIIAGVTIEMLSQGLSHDCIVRAMPNTPAQVGAGMTAWTATAGVTEQQKAWARNIFSAMGKEVYFTDEKYLDMATAVSGSGPAYFFLLAESMADAAEQIGLSREDAELLVLQTMLGSARLLEQSGKTPAELRRSVTSPGGTTERAVSVFEEGGFTKLVSEAVKAAYNRAKELGK